MVHTREKGGSGKHNANIRAPGISWGKNWLIVGQLSWVSWPQILSFTHHTFPDLLITLSIYWSPASNFKGLALTDNTSLWCPPDPPPSLLGVLPLVSWNNTTWTCTMSVSTGGQRERNANHLLAETMTFFHCVNTLSSSLQVGFATNGPLLLWICYLSRFLLPFCLL